MQTLEDLNRERPDEDVFKGVHEDFKREFVEWPLSRNLEYIQRFLNLKNGLAEGLVRIIFNESERITDIISKSGGGRTYQRGVYDPISPRAMSVLVDLEFSGKTILGYKISDKITNPQIRYAIFETILAQNERVSGNKS